MGFCGIDSWLQHFQIFPAYGIGPDLYLQYVKDLTGGHLCNGYTDFSKLEMHNCEIAVVHMWCWSVLRYLGSWKYLMQNIDQTDADWRRTLFSSRDCWSIAVCRIGSGYHTLRKSYQTFENMRSLCNLNVNRAELSPMWAVLRRYLIKELTI